MTVKEIFDERLYHLRWSYTRLAAKAGYAAKTSLTSRVFREDGMKMKVETLVELANVLGLQIILVSEDELDEEWILE